jgi:hypothetical protein
MNDEWRATPAGPEVTDQRTIGRLRRSASERNSEETGWLVDDKQRLVLVKNVEAARLESSFAPTAARPVAPDSHGVARCEPSSRLLHRRLGVVQKNLPTFQRRAYATARFESIGGGEEPIQPKPLFFRCDSPLSS